MALYLKLPGATGIRQSNMAAAKLGVVTSHLVDYIHRIKISTPTSTFSESRNTMALYLKLPGATGSRQSNMADAKPEVVISHLIDYIQSKFQRLNQHIRGLGTEDAWQLIIDQSMSKYIRECSTDYAHNVIMS